MEGASNRESAALIGAVPATALLGVQIASREEQMVTIYDGKPGLSRRELLKRGGIGALLVISGSAVISPEHAWGLETSAL